MLGLSLAVMARRPGCAGCRDTARSMGVDIVVMVTKGPADRNASRVTRTILGRAAVRGAWVPTFLGLLALLMVVPAANAGKGPSRKSVVAWSSSYAAASRSAAKDGKPLLLQVHGGWCAACAKMDETAWQDEEIGKLSESFVAALVNADVETVPAKRYGVTAYPTIIVAEPRGVEVLRLEGFKEVRVVKAYLTSYLRHHEALSGAFERLRASRRDAHALLVVAHFYNSVGLHGKAVQRYLAAMKSADGDTWLEATQGATSSLIEQGEYGAARKLLNKALKRAGGSPSPALMLSVARAEAGLGNLGPAERWFDRLLEEHGESDEAVFARTERTKL